MFFSDKDINAIFEDILFAEEAVIEKSYENGFTIGASQGNPEGYHLGYHRGAELGAELGFYSAISECVLKEFGNQSKISDDKAKSVNDLKQLIESFPKANVDNVDLFELMDKIRVKYKKVCVQFKISIKFPDSDKFSF